MAWDEGLEGFKDREAADYVTRAASTATVCASCGVSLTAECLLSLVVDLVHHIAPDGTEYRTYISHRQCREPALTVTSSPDPVQLRSLGAQFIVLRRTEAGKTLVPVLAYTIDPVVLFREPGGEPVSAHIVSLLSAGFRLSPHR
ncbi:hypothetical protein [Arthrobacter sp. SAFR-014]|uniref:hypothetical protein n=1 Tax=unclassified Arthrobacter TaxID=235627 RepID=UPI003F7CCEB6